MELIGYLCLFGMGMALGLIGAGGSILTIPILVQIFKIPIISATCYSLFIVGVCAFFGSIRYRSLILYRKASIFAIPSTISVFITRYYILPNLPLSIGHVTLSDTITVLFILVMLVAGFCMIRRAKLLDQIDYTDIKSLSPIKAGLVGIILGNIIGILGIGGSFLTISTLVFFLQLPMKQAVPTSLFITTLNASIGFISSNQVITSYYQLFLFTSIAASGMWIGTYMGYLVPGKYLKQAFGWFVFGTAIMMVITKWGL